MNRSHTFWYLSGFFVISIICLVVSIVMTMQSRELLRLAETSKLITDPSVLGKTSDTQSLPSVSFGQTRAGTASHPIYNYTFPVPTKSSFPVYTISLVSAPEELTQGDTATFTWYIHGPAKTIHTTTVYFGNQSSGGALSTSVAPADTHYTDSVKDFMDGNFFIPLQYIGNTTLMTAGTFFYRAYANIDGKHYWSGEHTFVVKELPHYEIKLVDHPTIVVAGANAAFTWDIEGPTTTTGFTAIVGGRESKPGALDATINIPKTPYGVLVNDFTSGTYGVPLRFIGNKKMSEPGVYYFRALAFINGKNIWSDEYSFTVQ